MTKDRLYGVGGWLGLLVVGLMFLGPLIGFGSTSSEISMTESSYPQVVGTLVWEQFKTVAWVSISLQAAVSIYAGFRLTNDFRPSSVQFAIVALWSVGVVIPLLSFWVMTGISGFDSSAAAGEMGQALFRGVLSAGVWTAYLLKSRRVENTYYADRASAPLQGDPASTVAIAKRVTWSGMSESQRKTMFFVACWIVLILVWAVLFDDDATEFFQSFSGTDWGRVWTWALVPPAFAIAAKWAFNRFVMTDSNSGNN